MYNRMETGDTLQSEEIDAAVKILEEKGEYPVFVRYAQRLQSEDYFQLDSVEVDLLKGRQLDTDSMKVLIV